MNTQNTSPSMQLKDWQNLFTLLCIIVLADEKIFMEEVSTLKDQAIKLKALIDPSLMLTERMISEWFETKIADIKLRMNGDGATEYINGIIDSLSHLPHRTDILAALETVADADGFKHTNELLVLRAVSDRWGD